MEKSSSSNEGYVKGVLSGDYIVVSGKLKKNPDEVPEEKNIFLSCVSAPKINSQTSYEEDTCGWESRNFLRNLVLGKIVKYNIDYTSGENSFAQVFIDGKNVNIETVKKGLAKVNSNRSNETLQKSEFFKAIKAAEAEAEKSKLGVWKGQTINRLKITKQDDVDTKSLFENIKGKEVNGMIEVAFNCSNLIILLTEPHNCVIKASLRFVGIPNKDSFFYKSGKAYVERLFLHRDVKLKALYLENNNFIVDVFDTKVNTNGTKETRNLSQLVLSAGLSKLFINTNFTNEKEDVEAAKLAQVKAQELGIRAWEGFKKDSKTPNLNIGNPEKLNSFEGTIQMVNTGDSLSIKSKDDGVVRRVFLSHTKAPTFAKPNTNDIDEPYAWQAKEYLRKLAVGKTVKAEYEFSKETKDGRIMNFFSVRITEGLEPININYELISKGLAKCNAPRGNSDSETSKYLESYIEAESKAKEAKQGIHSSKNPGAPNYCDLITEGPKKKKDFIPRNANLKKAQCVVEHVFSATRFKLRIDQTTSFIPFKLIGIKCVEKDVNNTKQLEELYLKGVDFVSDRYLQRDGLIDIVKNDRNGNYFGFLTVNNNNIANAVINEGLAVIHNPQAIVLPQEYKKCEEKAATEKIGIWSAEGLSTILKEGDVSSEQNTNKYTEKDEQIKIRIVDMVDFKSFYANILPNKVLSTIEKVLTDYDKGDKKGVALSPPIKKGINCILKYHEDFRHYRVKITAILKDDNFEVEFIDYGTIDVVHKRSLFKMDDDLATLPPQVVECELAALKFSKNSMTKSLSLYPNFIDLENVLPGKIVYSYVNTEGKEKLGVVVYFEKLTEIKKTVHYDLLAKGFAKFDKTKPIGKTLQEFKEAEKLAEKGSIGMWTEMEESDNEEGNY